MLRDQKYIEQMNRNAPTISPAELAWLQVGSIILEEDHPGGSLIISAAHRNGMIVIERVDRHDLLAALCKLLAQETP